MQKEKKKVSIFQIFILFLSVYVLAAIVVETIFKLPERTLQILDSIDSIICVIFLGDFFHRLWRAKSKVKFLKWGWIDFISSIPSLDVFRWGRLVRIIRILRILRAFRSTRVIVSFLYENRANGTFASVSMISFILMIFSSVAMLNLENSPDSNIKTPADALWWAFVTVTTVGYGDKYPVTVEGRLVAAVLMIAGVGLFGTLSGYIATYFLEAENEARESKDESEISNIKRELAAIKLQLELIQKSLSREEPARVPVIDAGMEPPEKRV